MAPWQRRLILSVLWCSVAVAAQDNPEAGRVERNGGQATLIVDSARPVDSAAITLAQEFGMRVNAEDPPYVYKDDITAPDFSRYPTLRRDVRIPTGGRLEVSFRIKSDGSPEDIPGLMHSLVDAANARFPFAYRLDVDGNWYSLVPTHTRDALSNAVEITPLLDRRIMIPPGKRSIAASAQLMADALSAQTGLRVSCCQAFVAGIPWGIAEVPFEAHDEPARDVLKRLIKAGAGRRETEYWLQRCDPLPSTWCFINVTRAPN